MTVSLLQQQNIVLERCRHFLCTLIRRYWRGLGLPGTRLPKAAEGADVLAGLIEKTLERENYYVA